MSPADMKFALPVLKLQGHIQKTPVDFSLIIKVKDMQACTMLIIQLVDDTRLLKTRNKVLF